jgi:TRAP-type C4-dicarboxylate transport system substrate-binding protein
MKRRVFQLSLAAAALALGTTSFAQTKWDLPAAYPATNFHSVNLATFAADVDKASGGKLKITVHPGASLFKAPEIKRAVQGGQAQVGRNPDGGIPERVADVSVPTACPSWPAATTIR